MKSIVERFYEKVTVGDGCWEWRGVRVGRSGDGYGQIYMSGKMVYANRVSWIIHRGEIPNGMFVLHDCDNKACVNPDHLHLGTNKQNMIEAAERGFKSKKLNPQKIRNIRKLKGIKSALELSKSYGVGFSTIYDIWRGTTWSHLK